MEEVGDYSNQACCLKAIECALHLVEHSAFDLSSHIGIAYGDVTIAILGGYNSEWVHVLNGPCLSQLSSCLDNAGPKEVAVTKQLFDNIASSDMYVFYANKNKPAPKSNASSSNIMTSSASVASVNNILSTITVEQCKSGNYIIREFNLSSPTTDKSFFVFFLIFAELNNSVEIQSCILSRA
jgi:hypothetical protein